MIENEWKKRCADRLFSTINIEPKEAESIASDLYDEVGGNHTPEDAADGETSYWDEG